MKTKFKFFSITMFVFALATSAFIEPQPIPEEAPEEEGISFAEFLSHFNKIELGYEVGLRDFSATKNLLEAKRKTKKKVKGKNIKRSVMMEYLVDVEHSMYSRMGPPEILPVARFYPDDQTVAIIYVPYRSFGRVETFTYKLACFDLQGNALPKQKDQWKTAYEIGEDGRQMSTTFRIDEQGNIRQSFYKKLWLKDVQKKGFVDNEVIGYELTGSKVLNIKSDGSVKEVENYIVSQ